MYLEIDEGFPGHRKTLRLCSLMSDAKAGWHMVWLWTWACRSCKDGDLRGMGAFEVEEAARYQTHDGKLCAAMIEAGFLDKDDTGSPIKIHNWEKRTGAAIAKMEADADRKKLYRAHRDGKCGRRCEWCKNVPGQSEDSPRTQPRTSTGQTDTDQTRPDQSRPDQISDQDLSVCPETPAAGRSRPVVDSPVLLSFPCDGDPNHWAMTDRQAAEWGESFPSLDVLAEARKALAWVHASPERRKTAKGMRRFLVGWFGRTQNGGLPRQASFTQDPSRGHYAATNEQPNQTGRLALP